MRGWVLKLAVTVAALVLLFRPAERARVIQAGVSYVVVEVLVVVLLTVLWLPSRRRG